MSLPVISKETQIKLYFAIAALAIVMLAVYGYSFKVASMETCKRYCEVQGGKLASTDGLSCACFVRELKPFNLTSEPQYSKASPTPYGPRVLVTPKTS